MYPILQSVSLAFFLSTAAIIKALVHLPEVQKSVLSLPFNQPYSIVES
jgi:hypothetical protein